MCQHNPKTLSRISLLLVVLAAVQPEAIAAAPTPADARQAWQMLDYIAVDYAGAVHDGKSLDSGEFAEMQEFAGSVRKHLAGLPASPQQPALLASAVRISKLRQQRGGRHLRILAGDCRLDAANTSPTDESYQQVSYAVGRFPATPTLVAVRHPSNWMGQSEFDSLTR